MNTLLDIAKVNGSDAVAGLIDEAAKAVPELSIIPARTIRGINYKTLVRTALPTVGFRSANEGAVVSKGTYENRLVETFILNPRWECDKAVADRDEDGPEAFIALEGSGITAAAFLTWAKQLYYGPDKGGDAKGFPGLIDVYDSTNMFVDAGGTTDNTASSVWAVKFGPQDVIAVAGNNGSFELDDVRLESVTDEDGNKFTAYVQEMLAYPGLQVGSIYSVGRIKKLTEDNGKGLTDALIAKLLAKFPVGKKPDALFMSRRSQEQLRASRTATNATGAPAPLPDEAFGVRIVVTDAISDTESLTL